MKKVIICRRAYCYQQPLLLRRTQKAKAALETAKGFVRQGDYPNAILILNRALQKDASNFELQKDLAFAYYLQRDYAHAMGVAKPLADREDADINLTRSLALFTKPWKKKGL